VLEPGEKCEPVSACHTLYDGCVSNADYVRARSGNPALCSAVCTETARTCSGNYWDDRNRSDGYCPSGCGLCSTTFGCSTGEDEDCGAGGKVIDSFDSPGSSCTGLSWNGLSLVFMDNLQNVYELGTNGVVKRTFTSEVASGWGLTWDGSGYWMHFSGNGIVKMDIGGAVVDSRPTIVGWTIEEALVWDGTYFWTTHWNNSRIYKWNAQGNQVLNFSADRYSAGVWDGVGLWFGMSDKYLVRLSTVGQLQKAIDLPKAGVPQIGYQICLAWDGTDFWVSSNSTFKIYRVRPPAD
jgi:hypothetical protein